MAVRQITSVKEIVAQLDEFPDDKEVVIVADTDLTEGEVADFTEVKYDTTLGAIAIHVEGRDHQDD